MVVVNSGPIFLPMILSTIKTYNTKPFQIHRIDVESQQPIFPCKAKPSNNQIVFIALCYSESIHTWIHLFGLFDIGMHS